MSEDQQAYERVIQEWAEATGMAEWPVEEDMHVEIDDTLVGLVYGGDDAPDTLHVYIDLGPREGADLHRRLLELNGQVQPGDAGCFAIHPATGSVVWRSSVLLHPGLSGSELPTQLAAMAGHARMRLHAA